MNPDHEAWRARMLPELDPGVAPYVDALREAGVETFESCEGGRERGHCYPEPTVRFGGDQEEGFRALAVALDHHFPVRALRRYWPVHEGGAGVPDWEIAFWWAANDPQARERNPEWAVDEPSMPFVDRLVRDGRLQRAEDGTVLGPRDPGWVEPPTLAAVP